MGISWRRLAGDTDIFALEMSFVTDDSDEDRVVSADERESWGALSIWIDGQNICAHTDQGESLEAIHWYMLPFLEWFATHWDPLFHEQRLPSERAGIDAATAGERVATQLEGAAYFETQLSEETFDQFDTWQSWYRRHSLRSAAPGCVLPDLFLRRAGDDLEFSLGTWRQSRVPLDISFRTGPFRRACDIGRTAAAIYDVIAEAARELLHRRPESERLTELLAVIERISSDDRSLARMSWLAGMGDSPDRFGELLAEVESAFAEVREEVQKFVTPEAVRDSDNLVVNAPPVALLFGALSPTLSGDDRSTLIRSAFLALPASDAQRVLDSLYEELETHIDPSLAPGEQGGALGDAAWHLLKPHDVMAGDALDLDKVLQHFGTTLNKVRLSDALIRAVSVVVPGRAPRVLVNENYAQGSTNHAILRFTIAHEIAHLILDRLSATGLAVASGPWAPLALEQRANGFAAGLLMPEEKLIALRTWEYADSPSLTQLRSIATRLQVSLSSLVDRLRNVGHISDWAADLILDRLHVS